MCIVLCNGSTVQWKLWWQNSSLGRKPRDSSTKNSLCIAADRIGPKENIKDRVREIRKQNLETL